jgi:hypothetical protein
LDLSNVTRVTSDALLLMRAVIMEPRGRNATISGNYRTIRRPQRR